MSTQFEFAVAGEHRALPGHFPGRPIVPGVLLLDHVLTGVAAALGQPVELLQQVKFAAALLPDETAWVSLETVAPSQVRFSVHVLRDGARVTLASGSLRLANAAADAP